MTATATLTDVATLDRELNEMILAGKAMEAFERFYAENVVMSDNDDEPWTGKDFNRKREEEFFASVAEVHDFSAGTLEALARAVDAKSPWTAGHSQRVTHLAVAIGRTLGLDGTELSRLYRGAMLHDMGKLGIPQQMLDKRGRLDDNEFSVVMSHTAIGERILEPIGAFAEIMPVVTQHHERYDGSGYPAGLAGESIDLKARILAVADVYDAMTNPRPYRESVEPREVVSMISAQSGTQFDPVVVGAFLEVIEVHGGVDSPDWIANQTSDQPGGAVGGTRVGGPPPGKVP